MTLSCMWSINNLTLCNLCTIYEPCITMVTTLPNYFKLCVSVREYEAQKKKTKSGIHECENIIHRIFCVSLQKKRYSYIFKFLLLKIIVNKYFRKTYYKIYPEAKHPLAFFWPTDTLLIFNSLKKIMTEYFYSY